MAVYTRAQLKSRINAGIKGKIGVLVDSNETINDTIREVISDIKLRSQKRRATLAPNLFSSIYQYGAPTDLEDQSIIDLSPQINRSVWSDWRLATPEEFDRRKTIEDRLISVDDHDEIRKILVSKTINDQSLSISTLDTITSGGGTWVVSGGAINLTADSDNFVKGSGSLKYDIGPSAVTTAGFKNTGLNIFDFTNYKNNSVFHWEYIQSTTGLTNFVMNLGSSTGDYYSKTVTTNNEGTAFTVGWNLLRFDFTAATQVGTPDLDAFNYAEIVMTKQTTKINETGYRADNIEAKRGEIYNLSYYSGYGWQTLAGVWIENSTLDSDYLNAGSSEYNLFILKGIQKAGAECDEYAAADRAGIEYEKLKDNYGTQNPDESLVLITTYYDFGDQDNGVSYLNNN